jgi:mRNA-degrading endonuclease RelE of RelBE toxin-antitoxin system
MPTRIGVSGRFKREIKRLVRKYPSIQQEVKDLETQLKNDLRPGDKMPNVGYDIYKVRLRNPSAGKGKRGGFRAIYYLFTGEHVILLTIYSKSEQEDVSLDVLRKIIKGISAEADEPPDA